MFAKSLLLFIVGSLNLLIALLVLARDYKRLQNILFFLFALSLGGWVIGIGGFLITNNATAAFHWAKVYYWFPLGIAAAMCLFSFSFPDNHRLSRKLWLPVAAGYLLIAVPLLVDHTFVTTRLVYHVWGKQIVLNKIDYSLYSIFLLGCFLVGLVHTYTKSLKLKGFAREQTRFYFFGFLITSVFGVLFNLIYPWFGDYRLIWLGPLFTSAFIIGIGYSIIRHRMFDIRLVVARVLAYSLSITVLLGGYAVLFYIAINNLSSQLPSGWKTVVNLLLILIAAASYGPLKRYFDRLTNRLFYRDAYDPQAFLDQLNRALVTNLNLEKLLMAAASVIVANLKADWCLFGIRETGFRGIRIIGTLAKHFKSEDILAVRQITPHLQASVIVTDNLSPAQQKLKSLLVQNDIAMLARLAPNNRTEEGLGYILLGPKKSGNSYSAGDERIIDLISRELLIAIQNALHFEEIQNFNVTLQQKVDNATSALRRANERLEKLDETKDDFISMASHQLRTPLTSVKGYLSLILDGDVGHITSVQKKMLEQAFASSQRMVYLIADLLNVSRLKSGKFVIEPAPVNLSEVVASEMDQLVQTAKGKDLTLTYTPPKDFPVLMLDETKTRQVIMNFIDNAIYYTPSGGKIEVKLEQTPHAVELRVIDNGIGVPASERPHLFTKFYRAQNAQKARPDGTGLGLFMAKKVIVGEGGAIIFDSEENKGSTFGFSFPLAKLSVKPAKPLEDSEEAASASPSRKETAKELVVN